MKEPRIMECEDCGYLKWIYDKGMDLCPECREYRWKRADAIDFSRRDLVDYSGTYFIQGVNKRDEYYGLVKIGAAYNPVERLTVIQTKVRRKLGFLGVEFGGRAREGELHLLFKSYRRHLEWFVPADELMEYIFTNTLGIDEFLEMQDERVCGSTENRRLYMPYPHPVLHMHGAWEVHKNKSWVNSDPAYAPMLSIPYMTKVPTPTSMLNPSRDELREIQLPLFPPASEQEQSA